MEYQVKTKYSIISEQTCTKSLDSADLLEHLQDYFEGEVPSIEEITKEVNDYVNYNLQPEDLIDCNASEVYEYDTSEVLNIEELVNYLSSRVVKLNSCCENYTNYNFCPECGKKLRINKD